MRPFHLFCLFCCLLSLHAENIVRIASYNLRNYLSCDRMVEDKWRPNYPKPEIEKKAVRSIIRSVNPDILVLQEMGDYPYLLELWRDLNVTGGPYYPYAVWKPNQEVDEVRHLAVFSKYSPIAVEHYLDLPFSYFEGVEKSGRGLLEISFRPFESNFHLFNLHLKSMWTERKDDPMALVRREKEARVIRDLIRKKYPPLSKPNYLVVGDFNDHKNSAPLKRFMSVSDTILTQPVPCVDSRGHFWTHYFKKQDSYSRIDYILASSEMMKHHIPNSGRIMDFPEADIASDHRMIYADFSF